jgi:Na+/melibiose symporter-like transporter
MDCKWWSSTPARRPQNGPNGHHGLSFMSQSLILYLSWVHGRNIFLCFMYFGLGSMKLPRSAYSCFIEYQLIVGLINPNYNSNSRLVSFKSVFPSSGLWVSNFIVLLNQKKVNGKNHTLPGIRTQNLWVSSR